MANSLAKNATTVKLKNRAFKLWMLIGNANVNQVTQNKRCPAGDTLQHSLR